MHASSDIPKPAADLLCWLVDNIDGNTPGADAVRFPDGIPERLRSPAAIRYLERRGLIRLATRITDRFGGFVGWRRALETDPADTVYVGLTREGRAWADERELAQTEGENPSDGRSQAVQVAPAAKPARRKRRLPALPLEMTPKQEFVHALRTGSPRPSFGQIAKLMSEHFGEPITDEAVRRLYRRAVTVKEAQGASVRPRLTYREGEPDSA